MQTQGKILVLATEHCAYPGADNVGRSHIDCPSNVYLMRVPAPVMFPDDFYYRCFAKGVSAIIIMTCGHECPYQGAYDLVASRIDRVYKQLKTLWRDWLPQSGLAILRQPTADGIDPRRLRICSICTVCNKQFVKEVNDMNNLLSEIGAVESPIRA